MSGYNFDNASLLLQTCEDLLYGDWPRANRRALINKLFNGAPPYTEQEAEESHVRINVNKLSGPRLAHSARAQFMNGFMTPGRYFTCATDMGSKHKRGLWGSIVTKEANRPLKDSIGYFEAMRSKFASLVLHGIAPTVWENPDKAIPRAIGIEDALLPGNTLLGFENLPFFVLRRSFTGMELQRATMGAKRARGWNMPLVRRCLEWMDKEMIGLNTQNWKDWWSPEKLEERIKENGFAYASDECPTLDCFDIYGYMEATEKQPAGWVRRIIIDGYDNPPAGSGKFNADFKKMLDAEGKDIAKAGPNDFIFSSGAKTIADTWQNIVGFQYADLSAVSPFRYHAVRSLGWMMYASCHIENRLTCKIYKSAFEALMQYFRVNSSDDVQRALKFELANMGFLDDTITPVPAAERWQPNANLIEYVNQICEQTIETNSQSWTQSASQSTKGSAEKTKFQVAAELQSVNALVSAGINQAWEYQKFEDREIMRRMFRPNSKDVMVQTFRAACLRQGVPENLLVPEAWDVQPERMMGGGNQTLEMMIAQGLMEIRQTLDPQPQREVDRIYVQALTHQPQLVEMLVPEKPEISDSIHDTEQCFATLMQGIPVTPKSGLNAIEVAGVTIKMMQAKVQQIMQAGGVGTPADLLGLSTAAQYAGAFIKQLEGDESEKGNAKGLADALGKVMNEVKAMAQRQQEMAKKAAAQQQNGNGGIDPKTAAAVKGKMLTDAQKLQTKKQTDALKLQQNDAKFKQGLVHRHVEHIADLASKDLETAATIHRGGMASLNEGEE